LWLVVIYCGCAVKYLPRYNTVHIVQRNCSQKPRNIITDQDTIDQTSNQLNANVFKEDMLKSV
jgi:hypothetical protein